MTDLSQLTDTARAIAVEKNAAAAGAVDAAPAVDYDVIVIGAGFSGMYLLQTLREQGLTVHAYETGDGVGGTWYWNRYPGARCDVESMYYSYSFSSELEQQWNWTERYPAQAEILRYANHVADRFDLRKDISFETVVQSAAFDEDTRRWTVTTDTGATASAQFLVSAVGCLSSARVPDFPGVADFAGQTYHTGRWPHEGVDFTGQRVAVIGTGSSAIQAIPVIAEQAAHLTVFQRTANYSIPARNHPLDPAEQQKVKADFQNIREAARHSGGGVVTQTSPIPLMQTDQAQWRAELDKRWDFGGLTFLSAYADIGVDQQANDKVADYVRSRIAAVVNDPATAALLTPNDHPIGTKRICADTNYFETYNRDNVTLVGIRTAPIERITEKGVVAGGVEYEVDAIVFATGYDAMTGPLNKIDIHGRGGQTLRDKWEAGPRTYLGVASAGFPNLFLITGPGSPSVLSNMMVSIEQHVEWVAASIDFVRHHNVTLMEAQVDAEDAWVAHVNTVANYTLHPKAASWYMGANIPGKPRIFMPYIGGVGTYRDECDAVSAAGYKGFALT